ncbi:MAG: molybdenum cofactor guanylyltransferase [Bacteroidales bacterium]|nr:molybdenum cofactor guanylyltransferase [Bacteroidales bacterium]
MEHSFDKSKFTAAILAGGKNTRFSGRTKAKMMIRGKVLIEQTLDKLETIFDDIIIITNNRSEFADYKHIRMYGDIYHGKGPLGGLHSALTNSDKNHVFLLASDMPDIDPGLIKRMLCEYTGNECDALLPSHGGFIEPLHAVYRKTILPSLNTYLIMSDRLAIRDFLPLFNARYFELQDIEKRNVFSNINSREDLDSYLKT